MDGTALAAPLPTNGSRASAEESSADGTDSAPRAAVTAASFDSLVEEHFQKVYNVIYRYIGDHEEASDLTQDVFVRAYQSFDHFRGDSQIYTWLYRIALNLCHNRLKQLRRRNRVEQESLDAPLNLDGEEIRREVADWDHAPTTLAEGAELNRLLHRAIGSLSPGHRTVIILRDIQGLSYAEIAEVTGSSLEAIKSRLFRARSQLKLVLQPYLEDSVV
ncbi:MAG: RNA polymerase subunit sigma-24 [Armatimonadetes bacterium CG_4_10_14_3_um_filter_66_18]|nr:sigma-70 family RNA polymerase sigma factor [Armatimonadota bacterium]PIU93987.1 MAG: RNA polymerase subunit sigma-24 [Armatimonadetes bacterium CG06_land_8_20_14_3_00_66_21]PIW16741.1 MAG: RNA polymerase subunit sigma-24 [Armatimonadetes bacterium CG17_big_fil_post_rev_8_21_14_2_50_66_6]PIX49014.1 MAG: RNA polymerase subunit sigma-24 [Armatimonadetes bacterium CG_4_8_14_3_um_filter_66_20]PIY36933.1 MAG: RNA polymerase subunit sigma-24 [Armatimonadetes bacterium CG_4_10_14_3_um_filter_66_18]